MLPRLGDLNEVEVEVVSKTRAEYKDEQYRRSGLPLAPAVMLDDEMVSQGGPIDEVGLRDLIATRQIV